jgi:hypothetical protein
VGYGVQNLMSQCVYHPVPECTTHLDVDFRGENLESMAPVNWGCWSQQELMVPEQELEEHSWAS